MAQKKVAAGSKKPSKVQRLQAVREFAEDVGFVPPGNELHRKVLALAGLKATEAAVSDRTLRNDRRVIREEQVLDLRRRRTFWMDMSALALYRSQKIKAADVAALMSVETKMLGLDRVDDIAPAHLLDARPTVGFDDFKASVIPDFSDSKLSRALSNVCEEIKLYYETKGETGIGKLVISMPRRYAKTTTVCAFAAWFLEEFPEARVIIVSATLDMVVRISNKLRSFVKRPLSKTTNSKMNFDLAGFTGGVNARSVGSGATSIGYDLLIVDDLVRTRADSMSPTIMDTIWEELADSILNAADERYAPVIMIGTRWSINDPIGRFKEKFHDEVVDFKLPALVSDNPYRITDRAGNILYERYPDEPLDSRKHTLEELQAERDNTAPYSWSSLWQQEPVEIQGDFFLREWLTNNIVYRDHLEAVGIKQQIRGWDLALSEHGDNSASALIAEGNDGLFYLIDVTAARMDFGKLPEFMAQTILQDGKSTAQVIEKAGYTTRAVDILNKDLRLNAYGIRAQDVDGNKTVRALPLQGKMASGRFKIVKGAWNDAYIDELCAFPPRSGKGNDDRVDATTLAYNALISRRNRLLIQGAVHDIESA